MEIVLNECILGQDRFDQYLPGSLKEVTHDKRIIFKTTQIYCRANDATEVKNRKISIT